MKKARAERKPRRRSPRDLNAELRAAMADRKAVRWARKTEFTRRSDGSIRRRIVLPDGTVEKDDVIPADDWAQAARAGTAVRG